MPYRYILLEEGNNIWYKINKIQQFITKETFISSFIHMFQVFYFLYLVSYSFSLINIASEIFLEH